MFFGASPVFSNALFAVGLDKRGYAHGIRAFSVHPGRIMTDLVRFMTDEEKQAANKDLKTVEQGAATSVWCATSPQLEGKGGVFCMDADIARAIPPESIDGETSQVMNGVVNWAIDPELAERLWALSERMTGVKFES